MKIPMISALVLGLASTAVANPIQWTTEEGGNGHFYEAINVPGSLSWTGAQLFAEALGGHLATLTSAAENTFVFENVVDDLSLWKIDSFGFLIGPYIGLFQDTSSPSYSEPDGGWVWLTGEDLLFSSWAAGQPNNVGGQGYGHFWAGRSTVPLPTWQDIQNSDPVNSPVSFVVEYVPTPGTALPLIASGVLLGRRRRS